MFRKISSKFELLSKAGSVFVCPLRIIVQFYGQNFFLFEIFSFLKNLKISFFWFLVIFCAGKFGQITQFRSLLCFSWFEMKCWKMCHLFLRRKHGISSCPFLRRVEGNKIIGDCTVKNTGRMEKKCRGGILLNQLPTTKPRRRRRRRRLRRRRGWNFVWPRLIRPVVPWRINRSNTRNWSSGAHRPISRRFGRHLDLPCRKRLRVPPPPSSVSFRDTETDETMFWDWCWVSTTIFHSMLLGACKNENWVISFVHSLGGGGGSAVGDSFFLLVHVKRVASMKNFSPWVIRLYGAGDSGEPRGLVGWSVSGNGRKKLRDCLVLERGNVLCRIN